MNNNIKFISIAIIACLFGLGIGYFFASKKSASSNPPIPASANPPISTSAQHQTWTCAMHPQIRRNEPGLCPICEMELIPVELNASGNPLVLQMTNEAVKLSNIQTTIIGQKLSGKGKEIRLSGKVQTDERLASSQVTHVPGRIEKLFVTFTGEQIAKGQKLANLYSPDLIAAQQELLEALKLSDLNPGLLKAARNKLRFWKIDDATIQNIEQNGKIQEVFTLFADASGIVTKRRVAVGDYLKRGEPLFDLMQLDKVWVLFDAYEEDLADIRIGDLITFTTPALPEKSFKANIAFIDPFINPKTRVAALRVEVNNPNGLLKPELFVTGTLLMKSPAGQKLAIPKSAVLWTGKRSVVYIKIPNIPIPSYEYREVEIGEALGENYQVLSGLEAGEEVVTYGSFAIDAAAQLNNHASMMNKSVKIKGVNDQNITNFKSNTPAAFIDQLDKLVYKYISVKDALVNSDHQSAALAADAFSTGVKDMDMNLVQGRAHLFWMEQMRALTAHSDKIAQSSDIEIQRKQFDFLSNILIKTIQAFGTNHKSFFVQHCPMAIKAEGADWIALEEDIRNPYFGQQMLKCGTVTGSLPFESEPTQTKAVNIIQSHNH